MGREHLEKELEAILKDLEDQKNTPKNEKPNK